MRIAINFAFTEKGRNDAGRIYENAGALGFCQTPNVLHRCQGSSVCSATSLSYAAFGHVMLYFRKKGIVVNLAYSVEDSQSKVITESGKKVRNYTKSFFQLFFKNSPVASDVPGAGLMTLRHEVRFLGVSLGYALEEL